MKAIGTILAFLTIYTLSFGQKAPNFTITDYNGEVHNLYDDYLTNGKVVMLKIMFAACPPCNAAAPAIQDLYEIFGEGSMDVEFFDLSNKSWDSNASIKSYSEKHNLTFTGAGADGGALAAVSPYVSGTFGTFRGTPTYVVIAPDGDVHFNVPLSNLKTTIEDALDGGGGCSNAFSGEILNVIEPVQVALKSDVPGAQVFVLNENGAPEYGYDCEFPFPAQAFEYYLTVEKDDEDFIGVTTKDIVFTVRHLLGLQIFGSSQEKIAADFTTNNVISAKDISEMRKLILGVIPDNPWHNSWRFWNKDTDFSGDSSGVLIPDLIETVPLMDVVDSLMTGDFEGVKLGDVSGDINQFFNGPNQTRSTQEFYYNDRKVSAGEMVNVNVFAKDHLVISGVQSGMMINGTQRALVSPHNLDFHVRDAHELLNLVGYTAYDVHIDPFEPIYTLRFKPSRSGWISELMHQTKTGTPSLVLFGDNSEIDFILRPERSSENLIVFPNPTSSSVEVLTSKVITDIVISDISGRTVESTFVAEGNMAKVNLEHLRSGLYLITVKSARGTETTRLVKQ